MSTAKEKFKSDQERFEYTFGMTTTLRSFCVQMVRQHPAPELLLTLAESQGAGDIEGRLGNILEPPPTESLLRGIADTRTDLLSIIQGEVQRRQATVLPKTALPKANVNTGLTRIAFLEGSTALEFSHSAQKYANATWFWLAMGGAAWYFLGSKWAMVPAALLPALAAFRSVCATLVAVKLEKLEKRSQ